MAKIRILLADDHTLFRQGIRTLISAEADMEVIGEAANGGDAVDRANELKPDVVLMDEPCSALDPISTLAIEDLISELKQEFTIVIVTHNMQQAARISDHTAFFYLGELVEFDTTAKIFTNPSKKQTEDYVTGRFG